MTDDLAGRPRETTLLIVVPQAERLVGRWRERFDPSAADGVPAHITLLYPMGSPEGMTAEVLRDLADVFARVPAVEFRLERPGRFPEVLFLTPVPEESFRDLIRIAADQFPDYPPYGGAFDDPVPHLTVAQSEDQALLARIEAAIRPGLPVDARADAVTPRSRARMASGVPGSGSRSAPGRVVEWRNRDRHPVRAAGGAGGVPLGCPRDR
jgi:2'-5' RNA ligase